MAGIPFDSFSSNLKIENGELFGSKWLRKDKRILPEHILAAKRYGMFNPFFKIKTTHGSYKIGIACRQFDDVVQFIIEKTDVEIKYPADYKLLMFFAKLKIFRSKDENKGEE